MADAVAASTAAGFPSDVEKRGEITLFAARAGSDTVMLYSVDGEPELCFVQRGDDIIKIGD